MGFVQRGSSFLEAPLVHKHTDQGRVTLNMGVAYECASEEETLKLRFKR